MQINFTGYFLYLMISLGNLKSDYNNTYTYKIVQNMGKYMYSHNTLMVHIFAELIFAFFFVFFFGAFREIKFREILTFLKRGN